MMKVVSLLAIIILFLSCEKALLGDKSSESPNEIFEALWQDVDKRYSFFELKEINKDQLYNEFKEKIQENMTKQALFDTLASLLFRLEDGHVNLTSSFDRSRNWEWYENYPTNFNENIIKNNYLESDFRIAGPLQYKIINDVMYVRYSSFASGFSNANLNSVINAAKSTKGIIIDVRSNGGGALENAKRLAGVFFTDKTQFASERLKNGPKEDDFNEFSPMFIEPGSIETFSKKVVVLTNRRSYSATTFFAQMMKTNERAELVGDQTGGGGGIPMFGELPNGWKYRFSASQTIDLNGRQIEKGVEVDYSIDMDDNEEAQGIDTILEFALELF